jgi:metal-responsive CopG/Arc/MetJ family transcriptional regulator
MDAEKKVGRPPKDIEMVNFSIWIPKTLMDEIDRRASADKRSRSDWGRLLIERELKVS